jgi:hypothetical protein
LRAERDHELVRTRAGSRKHQRTPSSGFGLLLDRSLSFRFVLQRRFVELECRLPCHYRKSMLCRLNTQCY